MNITRTIIPVMIIITTRGKRCFTKRKPHAGHRKGRKMPFFVPSDLDLLPLTLTFKLVRARGQTRLPCEFGANLFSGSRDISYTNTNTSQTDGAKRRTFCSSLCTVTTSSSSAAAATTTTIIVSQRILEGGF